MTAQAWKNRASYGNILYRKAKRLRTRYEAEEKKNENANLETLEILSRMLDSTIVVQMKNLAKSEELDQLAKEEVRARREPTQQETQRTQDTTSWVY